MNRCFEEKLLTVKADGLKLRFHSLSLPTARLVWHCPFVSIFSSGDGQVNGKDFREYLLFRLNGENYESDDHQVENNIRAEKLPEFAGWDAWIEKLKQGLTFEVTIKRDKNRIT